MNIHVVRPGDTLYSVAQAYGVSLSRLISDNQLPDPSRLVVGQTLVIQYPLTTYVVRQGDTLSSLASRFHTTVRQIQRDNPALKGGTRLLPGQELVLSYRQERQGELGVLSYAYPSISRPLLTATLPYLSALSPFTYTFTSLGELMPLDDQALVDAALAAGTAPLLHLSNLEGDEGFSGALAHTLLSSQELQEKLADQVVRVLATHCYQGVDVDFENLYPEDAQAYPEFIRRLRSALSPRDVPIYVALAPKTDSDQTGQAAGHDYRLLGQAADRLLLMTYEWGYSFGPPMAVAPLPQVRKVAQYALSQIPAEKLLLGIPNYGYDWQLPHDSARRAPSISNQEAVALAWKHYAAIRYDDHAQAPWFRYVDQEGQEHEVWFEDARSIRAKLDLAHELGFWGVGYWNLMRPFPQNWLVLNALYQVRQEARP